MQVMLLVLAIVVAVAGIGIALALRMSARQRKRRAQQQLTKTRPRSARAGARPAAAPAQVIPLARARAEAAAEAATSKAPANQDPEAAHKAKLAALQALLALGDAKAEQAKGVSFADTQPAGDEYASTQFVDGAPNVSLLDLERLPAKRKSPGA
ncbi:MAG: hypothetical protein U1F56_11155 [Rubrivivax sp.]